MLSLLVKHRNSTGRDYTRALVNSQVVPSYEDLSLPAVTEYRAFMDKYRSTVPESLRDPKYTPPDV
jgi:branched-chain amino acid transport system substrate-binding protein